MIQTLLTLTSATVLLVTASLGWAREPFSPERFQTLQQQDATILIEISADWCSICAIQKRILNNFREDHPEVEWYQLVIDFDRDKQWVTEFRAPRQSTLLLYRGEQRLWFSVAEVSPDTIYKKIINAAR